MFFKLKTTKKIEMEGVEGTRKKVAIGRKIFIAVGVLHVQLAAYQVSMVSAAN